VCGEDSSHRDIVKVEAQYEVLEIVRMTVPSRQPRKTSGPGTIENARLLISHTASRVQSAVDRPVRDVSLGKS
jgi:hypothetical protein